MKNFNEKYRKRQFISRDKWSDTYKAVNSATKEIVTLKILNIQNQEEIKNIQSKIETLKEMESPNLISINSMESFVENEKTYYYIECEDFAGKKISDISAIEGFNSVEAIKIMRQVAEGLKEFHFKSFTYGNLDCEDIYIDNNGLVKLDTTAYLKNINANEDLEEEFSEEEDIFSLGVILFKLVTDNSEFKVGKCKNYIPAIVILQVRDLEGNIVDELSAKKIVEKYNICDFKKLKQLVDNKTIIDNKFIISKRVSTIPDECKGVGSGISTDPKRKTIER